MTIQDYIYERFSFVVRLCCKQLKLHMEVLKPGVCAVYKTKGCKSAEYYRYGFIARVSCYKDCVSVVIKRGVLHPVEGFVGDDSVIGDACSERTDIASTHIWETVLTDVTKPIIENELYDTLTDMMFAVLRDSTEIIYKIGELECDGSIYSHVNDFKRWSGTDEELLELCRKYDGKLNVAWCVEQMHGLKSLDWRVYDWSMCSYEMHRLKKFWPVYKKEDAVGNKPCVYKYLELNGELYLQCAVLEPDD